MIIHYENTALAAANKDPRKYGWYHFTGAKATFEHSHKTHDLVLTRGEKYGLKEYRGKVFLVDSDDLSVQFSLTPDEASKLVKRSKPWSGKVSRYKVKAGPSTLSAKPGGSPKASQGSMKGLDVLKALGNDKPQSVKDDGIHRKQIILPTTPSTAIRRMTKLGLPEAKRQEDNQYEKGNHYVECDDGIILIKRGSPNASEISFFKPTAWKKYLAKGPSDEKAKPTDPKTPVKPKATTVKGRKVQHVPQVNAASLIDSTHGMPLSSESMPVELKHPEIYAASLYGRDIDTGRSRDARSAVTVGFAHVKNKFCLVSAAISGSDIKLLINPYSRVDVNRHLRSPQVPYVEFLKIRAQAKKKINSIENNKKDAQQENHEKLSTLRPSPGQVATVAFNDKNSKETIVKVDHGSGKIAIKGGGSRLRWIPMSMVIGVE